MGICLIAASKVVAAIVGMILELFPEVVWSHQKSTRRLPRTGASPFTTYARAIQTRGKALMLYYTGRPIAVASYRGEVLEWPNRADC
jgi:hypothetical protein